MNLPCLMGEKITQLLRFYISRDKTLVSSYQVFNFQQTLLYIVASFHWALLTSHTAFQLGWGLDFTFILFFSFIVDLLLCLVSLSSCMTQFWQSFVCWADDLSLTLEYLVGMRCLCSYAMFDICQMWHNALWEIH